MFWAIWAAVGPVSREKSQHTGHCGGKGRQEAATRRARASWGPAQAAGPHRLGEVRQLSPGLTAASSVTYRAVMEMCGANPC